MVTAIDELRDVINWFDSQSEGFNDKIKTTEDLIKVYRYAISNDWEFLDSEYLYIYLSREGRVKVRKEMLQLLGYNVY